MTYLIASGYHGFLGEEHFFWWDLNAKVAASGHYAVRFLQL